MRHHIEHSAGRIDYVDTSGDCPVLVRAHGVPMNETQWRKVVPLLTGYRCILPTLPLGGHRQPMRPGADLTHTGVALLLGELLERLDLTDVTLALNDWGGGQFLVSEGRARRVGRVVLVACETFDNFPARTGEGLGGGRPGAGRDLAGRAAAADPLVPAQPTRLRRHEPARHPGRRLRRLDRAREKVPRDAPGLVRAARGLHGSRPGGVDAGRPADASRARPRLTALYPAGRLVEIAHSSTLVPEDQPERLAEATLAFLEDPTWTRVTERATSLLL